MKTNWYLQFKDIYPYKIVNKIIMKIKKKYIFLISSLILIILVPTISMRIYLNIVYPEHELKDKVNDFFKNRLKKAVKFESISLGFSGNIIINKFNLSATNDFNDNQSLVKCPEAIIGLRFMDLLKGDVKVQSLTFNNSTITFVKKYGSPYKDYFNSFNVYKQFLNSIIDRDIKELTTFNVEISNSNVFFKDSFKEKRIEIVFPNFNSDLEISKNQIIYQINSDLFHHKKSKMNQGNISISGTEDFKKDNSTIRLIADNLDLYLFDDFIEEYNLANISISGGISWYLEIERKKKDVGLSGRIETNNFYLTNQSGVVYNILSNENIDIDIDLKYNQSNNLLKIKHFQIEEDSLIFNMTGTVKHPDYYNVSYKTNKINLDNLSHYFTPLQNLSYSGTMESKGAFFIDFKNKKINKIRGNLILNNFTLSNYKNIKNKTIINKSKLTISLTKNSISLTGKTRILESDFKILGTTTVKKWFPFRSETRIDLESRKLEFPLVFNSGTYIIKEIFKKAYKDRNRGWVESQFLRNPLGKFINNNDIEINYTADILEINNKIKLKDLNLNLNLNNGILSTKNFNLKGNDADYSFHLNGYFKSEMPHVKFDGSINNFCLKKVKTDEKDEICQGKINMHCKYDLSFYRFSHIFENSKGNFAFSLTGGEIKETEIQHKLSRFLRKNGYNKVSINRIEPRNLSFSFSHYGESFYLRNIGINSKNVNFNTYGRYYYKKGYNLKLQASLKDSDNKLHQVPLVITGSLLEPCISIRGKKKKKLCLN